MISNGNDPFVVFMSKRATLVVVGRILRQEATRSPVQKDMTTESYGFMRGEMISCAWKMRDYNNCR